MRYFRFPLFLIITISLSVLLIDGCGDGDGGPPLEQSTRVERMIGPEGGTIEVTDPYSPIYGVKVDIPAGALASEATIIISQTYLAPSLPTGLTSDNPVVELSTDTAFLKDIEITFPIEYIPYSDEELLSAFYWDTDNAKWIVVPPKQINDYKMIIKTDHFSLWRWGIVMLAEVEAETATAWLEDMFDDWSELQATLEDQVEPFLSAVQDPESWTYCDTRDIILGLFDSMRQGAKERIKNYLDSVWDECKILNLDNEWVNCDESALISGQPVAWLAIEIRTWLVEQLASAVLAFPSNSDDTRQVRNLQLAGLVQAFVEEILGAILAKLIAYEYYQHAIRTIDCDYRCVLENGNFDFYSDLFIGNACSFIIFGIEYYQSDYPCY